MTPHDLVLEHYTFPFQFRPFQIEAINTLSPLPRTGLYLEPGLGKTAVSTACALYKLIKGEAGAVLVIVPPLLVTQWVRWLSRVKLRDGRSLRVVPYEGPPKKRRSLSFDADFVLSGIQVFKRDLERIERETMSRRWHVILDEAHCIKDVASGNYHYYRDYVEGRTHQLLTGTPLNVPIDAYAYCNLVSPGAYRNLLHFETEHVEAKDIFKRPCEYKNLELLQHNLLLNSIRKTKEGVLPDLPEAIVTEIEYDLDPRHYALYKELAMTKLLRLKDDEKIDATQASALFHALGQIVCQWHYFGQDDKLKSNIYTLIEEVVDELGDKKLIVFSNYQRTNEEVVRRYNAPGIWGAIPPKQKLLNLNRFLDDPKCRLIAMHPVSAGQGVDGCQHVCTDVLYSEPPVTPSHLTQSLSRVHREGQTRSVTVRLAVARGTLQRDRVSVLAEKEELVNPIQGSKTYLTGSEIKRIIFGETLGYALRLDT